MPKNITQLHLSSEIEVLEAWGELQIGEFLRISIIFGAHPHYNLQREVDFSGQLQTSKTSISELRWSWMMFLGIVIP